MKAQNCLYHRYLKYYIFPRVIIHLVMSQPQNKPRQTNFHLRVLNSSEPSGLGHSVHCWHKTTHSH